MVVRVEQDVRWLEVGVDDALRMGERESVRDLDGDAHGVAGLERTHALDATFERSAREVLHHDVRKVVHLADVEDGDDVRVGELGKRARFLHEHAAQVAVSGGRGVEDLDGDLALERGVLRQVDLGGPTGA